MMPYPPQMPVAPPPRKKGMSGWLIALVVVASVVLVGMIGAGVGVYLLATSDVGKTTIKVIGEGSKLAAKGVTAPGTTEIRALGCEQAVVVDSKDVSAIVNDLVDGGFDAGLDFLVVTCQVGAKAAAPSCDDVARTYVRAVGTASSPFMASVQRDGEQNALCEATYDASGALIGTSATLPTGSGI